MGVRKAQRIVQPFTREALRPDTKVLPLPKLKTETFPLTPSHAFRGLVAEDDILSKLPMVNERLSKDLPFDEKCQKSLRDCNFYLQYLPIFFDGLCDSASSVRRTAQKGLDLLINITRAKIFTIIPSLIVPIKRALKTRKQEVIVATLRAIQRIVKKGPCAGEVLVRHYREFLPLLNPYCCLKTNICDQIHDTPQIDDVIYETLQVLEHFGGDQRLAYITIKYIIPTYESFFFNT